MAGPNERPVPWEGTDEKLEGALARFFPRPLNAFNRDAREYAIRGMGSGGSHYGATAYPSMANQNIPDPISQGASWVPVDFPDSGYGIRFNGPSGFVLLISQGLPRGDFHMPGHKELISLHPGEEIIFQQSGRYHMLCVPWWTHINGAGVSVDPQNSVENFWPDTITIISSATPAGNARMIPWPSHQQFHHTGWSAAMAAVYGALPAEKYGFEYALINWGRLERLVMQFPNHTDPVGHPNSIWIEPFTWDASPNAWQIGATAAGPEIWPFDNPAVLGPFNDSYFDVDVRRFESLHVFGFFGENNNPVFRPQWSATAYPDRS